MSGLSASLADSSSLNHTRKSHNSILIRSVGNYDLEGREDAGRSPDAEHWVVAEVWSWSPAHRRPLSLAGLGSRITLELLVTWTGVWTGEHTI